MVQFHSEGRMSALTQRHNLTNQKPNTEEDQSSPLAALPTKYRGSEPKEADWKRGAWRSGGLDNY